MFHESQETFTSNYLLTIDLDINEAWCYHSVVTVDYDSCLLLLVKEQLHIIEDFAISHPQILFDYPVVTENTAVYELLKLADINHFDSALKSSESMRFNLRRQNFRSKLKRNENRKTQNNKAKVHEALMASFFNHYGTMFMINRNNNSL